MTTSKKKCRNCKDYKRTESMINIFGVYFCNREGAASYANQKKNIAKGKKIKETAQKKNFKLSDRKARKTALRKACHKYIRERDKDELCICCNKPLGDDYHAGHWKESGNNPHIRYDEDNIHAQRKYCNTYKGGDSGDYEKNLRKRIGDERVNRLLGFLCGRDKMKTDDMLNLEQHYKQKLKLMLQ